MDDRTRWDGKYGGALGAQRTAPDPFVLSALNRLGPPAAGRRALDLAAGTGRHAFELAARGWETSAWDVSPVGLAILSERALEADLPVTTRAIDVLQAVDGVALPTFDLVVSVLFLDRPLMARLADFVAPGGHLIFATATVDYSGEKPPARFRLERGELERGIPGLETVHVVETGGWAGIIACRGDEPSP